MKVWKMLCVIGLIAVMLFGCASPKKEDAGTEPTEKNQSQEETPPANQEEPELQPNSQPLKDTMGEGFLTTTSLETQVPCKVRVFKEERPEEFCYMICIEVDTGVEVLKKELTFCVPYEEDYLYCVDIDSDGVQEIILHHNTGGCGGFGQYISWIMKVTEEDILIIWDSADLFDTGFNTGFKGVVADGYQLKVTHPVNDYVLLFEAKENHKIYFDETGKADCDHEFMIDSFYEFEPLDKDKDGVFEIYCKQYASLRGHADYVGSACSVWEWNNETNKLEIIDAWFEPNTED